MVEIQSNKNPAEELHLSFGSGAFFPLRARLSWQSNSKVADTQTSSTTPTETATTQQHILFLYFFPPSMPFQSQTVTVEERTITLIIFAFGICLASPMQGLHRHHNRFSVAHKKCWLTRRSEPSLLHEKKLPTIKNDKTSFLQQSKSSCKFWQPKDG